MYGLRSSRDSTSTPKSNRPAGMRSQAWRGAPSYSQGIEPFQPQPVDGESMRVEERPSKRQKKGGKKQKKGERKSSTESPTRSVANPPAHRDPFFAFCPGRSRLVCVAAELELGAADKTDGQTVVVAAPEELESLVESLAGYLYLVDEDVDCRRR
ncbi:hypothetical protein TEQG_01223 [Trichophyton equinum CBS 127.97]|uniref:Uncharacterized protein n=1 Tax=Trichophyton equinum (strain ATCC MYA-4606 / CBS 127.97) TaxID=559882 RepID=F2PJW6_TRIEC|nr:hypothetical protein TEQG_01223 [Trichophyton equinum CBS 127.97]